MSNHPCLQFYSVRDFCNGFFTLANYLFNLKSSVTLFNCTFINIGIAGLHQPLCIKFPVFVAISPEPSQVRNLKRANFYSASASAYVEITCRNI